MTIPLRTTLYRGYSSVNRTKLTNLFDVDLVKQDLLNHFNTRKSERVRQPSYGSAILDYLFELQTEGNVQRIVEEVLRIIEEETRVRLLDIAVIEEEYSVTVDCDLLYVGANTQFDFKVKFDADAGIIQEIEE